MFILSRPHQTTVSHQEAILSMVTYVIIYTCTHVLCKLEFNNMYKFHALSSKLNLPIFAACNSYHILYGQLKLYHFYLLNTATLKVTTFKQRLLLVLLCDGIIMLTFISNRQQFITASCHINSPLCNCVIIWYHMCVGAHHGSPLIRYVLHTFS